jgi:hypothetical protein
VGCVEALAWCAGTPMAMPPLGGGAEMEGDPDEDAGEDEEGSEEKCG